MRLAAGGFIVFHGLVHFMYVGQAMQWFELRAGMVWPIGARLVPAGISATALRSLVAITIGTASVALVAGGVGIAVDAGWGNWLTVAAAVFLSLLHILFWDGDVKTSPDQGLYGIIINIVIVAWLIATW